MKLSTLTNLSTVTVLLLTNQVVNAQEAALLNPGRLETDLTEEAEAQAETEKLLSQVEEMPAPMVVKSLFGGQFTTGAGVGYESSFGSVFGFIPFAQTPGESLYYFNGRANVDTEDGNFGGNALLGYRQYAPQLDTVFGGYIGLDIQNTSHEHTFNQIGVGFEALGNPWEFRANGYIPLGDRRELITEVNIADQTTASTTFNFQDNFLAFSSLIPGNTNIKVYEESLMGLDIEGGVRLLDWGNGNLRGYLGAYFYDTPSGSGFVGLSSRLLAEVSDNFNAGIAFTTDGEFGTNLVFTVGASLGGAPNAKKNQSALESVVARLGDRLHRQPTIALRQKKEETITPTTEENGFVTNPTTGQPWEFVHISPGGNSDGTFEDPFGSMDEAIAVVPEHAIIYVDDFAETPGDFTIPDTVQVLSRGPQQFIDTVEFNTIQIPLSGNGNYPTIAGTVTMGNNTVLSGFDINPTIGNAAIRANDVSNLSIRHNIIEDITLEEDDVAAILLEDVSGDIELLSNTLTDIDLDGILIATSEEEAATITIADNTFNNVGSYENNKYKYQYHAIHIDSYNNPLTTIEITDNQLSESGSIYINNKYVETANVTIADNNLTNNDGIYVFNKYTDTANVTITDNQISESDSKYLEIGILNSQVENAKITISNNNLTNNNDGGYIGLGILNYNVETADVTITDNNFIDSNGIYVVNLGKYDEITANISISGNTVTNENSKYGNSISVLSGGFQGITNGNTTITDNTVSGGGIKYLSGGIAHTFNNQVEISDNEVTDASFGVKYAALSKYQSTTNSNVTIAGNNITNVEYGVKYGILGNFLETNSSVTISGNTITNADTGIRTGSVSFGNSAPSNVSPNITVTENNITDVDTGIRFSQLINDNGGSQKSIVNILDNNVSTVSSESIILEQVYNPGHVSGDQSLCANIGGNVLDSNANVALDNLSSGDFSVINLSTLQGDPDINLTEIGTIDDNCSP